MRVYILYREYDTEHVIYEKVSSVHKTEAGAEAALQSIDESRRYLYFIDTEDLLE